MSNFGKVSEENRAQARPTFSSNFLKLTAEHQTVIRILDEEPIVVFQHFVSKGHPSFPKANAGKGMSFSCPNDATNNTCPICAYNKKEWAIDKKSPNVLKKRKTYAFNVLERTMVVVCPKCGNEMFESGKVFPDRCSCGADLTKVDAAPRNKIMILQKGQTIIDQLDMYEKDPDLGDVRGYDIKIDTKGSGTKVVYTCVPKQVVTLNLEEILGADWETKLFDIKSIVAPMDIEKITRILNGEDWKAVFKPEDSTTEATKEEELF